MTNKPLAFLICLAFMVVTYGQKGAPPSDQPSPPGADNRIRVVVDVVSVDAIVTDKDGQHVRDLRTSDFEIFQDGELQKITNFTYVNAAPEATIDDGAADKTSSAAVPERSVLPEFLNEPVRRADVLRSIAVVVDDIGMSFDNLVFVRQALAEFVEEQIHPTDLVAISLTSSRTGALAQFTTNKDLLNRAVNRLRWGAVHRVRAFDRGSIDRQFSLQKRGDTIEERNRAMGTLHSVKYTLENMGDLPGRKSVILVSEGYRLWYDELEGVGGSTNAMVESLRKVMHAAHRSGAVIYAVDPRGGESLGLHPRDDFSNVVRWSQEVYQEIQEVVDQDPGAEASRILDQRLGPGIRLQLMDSEDVETLMDANMFAEIGAIRLRRFYQTQEGLNYLPVATGGLYLKYNNDINANLEQVLNDQQGYYLIGYAPDPQSIRSQGSRRFPRISVKVKPDGLTVRGRSTFMGTLDGEKDRAEPTPEEQMRRYMASPFSSDQIPLELTSLHEHNSGEGAFVSSWLHVSAEELSFSEEEDGWKKAEVEVWAATFGEKVEPAEEKRETFFFRVRGESYERVLRDGLVYTVRLAVKKSGPHQLRMVLRDKGSGRIGSASRFLQIPDVEAGRLALSGIVVRGSDSNSVATETDGKVNGDDMALRRFRRGTLLNFALYIYNAELDRSTRTPQLETQVKLFKEGREIYAGEKRKKTFEPEGKLEESVVIASGHFQLGTKMDTGHYAMQYTVTDKLVDDDYGTVSQWIDFQILD